MIYRKDMFVKIQAIKGKIYIAKNTDVFELDEVGIFIWEKIDGKNSLEDIVFAVSKKYNQTIENIYSDVKDFINDLHNNNLVMETKV